LSDPAAPISAKLSDPQQVLESVFGYREFRPGQRRIIDAVLAGRDCIGVMPTGAGKSLTFQLPAKMLPITVTVPKVLRPPPNWAELPAKLIHAFSRLSLELLRLEMH